MQFGFWSITATPPRPRFPTREELAADVERIEARHRAELLASAAATIGRIDAWLATSRRVEHRTTKAVWCGMCGDLYFPGCCGWSAGVFEHRAARPQQCTMVDGEVVEIEHRPSRIVSVR